MLLTELSRPNKKAPEIDIGTSESTSPAATIRHAFPCLECIALLRCEDSVAAAYTDAYLNEFVSRFNRRYSCHRGLLLFKLQYAAVTPTQLDIG